jgi:hypothetical protein
VPIGWPTDDQLAAKLGPHVTVDDLVTSANEAAQAGAVRHGSFSGSVDPDTGATTAEAFEAILALGVNWYQDRNQDPAYVQSGEFATNVIPRQRALDILRAGKPAIA